MDGDTNDVPLSKMADERQKSLLEPKEEPLDDFLFMPADNEISQFSADGICKKEELEDEMAPIPFDVDSFDFPYPDANPIFTQSQDDLFNLRRDYLKEEEEEIETEDVNEKEGEKKIHVNIHNPKDSSETVEVKKRRPTRNSSEPLSDEETVNHSVGVEEPSEKKLMPESKKKRRSNIVGSQIETERKKRRVSKMNYTDLECPECGHLTRYVVSYLDHLKKKHSATLALEGLSLRCECGHESLSDEHSRLCDISKLTIICKKNGSYQKSENEKSTPQCVLCEFYPETARDYSSHLSAHHKSSLRGNGIYLICSCGDEIRSEYSASIHNKKCDGHHFSLYKLDEKKTPKCILCEFYPSTPRGYIDHLRVHHKTSLKENDIYLICSCGFVFHIQRDCKKHNQKCDGGPYKFSPHNFIPFKLGRN